MIEVTTLAIAALLLTLPLLINSDLLVRHTDTQLEYVTWGGLCPATIYTLCLAVGVVIVSRKRRFIHMFS